MRSLSSVFLFTPSYLLLSLYLYSLPLSVSSLPRLVLLVLYYLSSVFFLFSCSPIILGFLETFCFPFSHFCKFIPTKLFFFSFGYGLLCCLIPSSKFNLGFSFAFCVLFSFMHVSLSGSFFLLIHVLIKFSWFCVSLHRCSRL